MYFGEEKKTGSFYRRWNFQNYDILFEKLIRYIVVKAVDVKLGFPEGKVR